jgi:hypothetical protein
MFTNAKCTVFVKETKGRANIYKSFIYNCHFEENRGFNLTASARAVDEVNNVKIFINLHEITKAISKGDFICKGEINGNFASLELIKKQQPKTYIITSVDTFDYGSKHLQHIKIGAK